MKFAFTKRFQKDYKRSPKHIQQSTDKQLRLLAENPDHPSLDINKMSDPRGIWRCKITVGYRFTFQIQGNTWILRRMSPHDIEREP